MRSNCLMHGVFIQGDENVLELDRGGECTLRIY